MSRKKPRTMPTPTAQQASSSQPPPQPQATTTSPNDELSAGVTPIEEGNGGSGNAIVAAAESRDTQPRAIVVEVVTAQASAEPATPVAPVVTPSEVQTPAPVAPTQPSTPSAVFSNPPAPQPVPTAQPAAPAQVPASAPAPVSQAGSASAPQTLKDSHIMALGLYDDALAALKGKSSPQEVALDLVYFLTESLTLIVGLAANSSEPTAAALLQGLGATIANANPAQLLKTVNTAMSMRLMESFAPKPKR